MKKLACLLAVAACSFALAHGGNPFRASIDTQVENGPPCVPACVNLYITGTGQGTHLGNLSMAGPSTVDFATLAQSGESVLTAADGSTLSIEFAGTFIPGLNPGDATFSGEWRLVSGTGRFAGADGGGRYHGIATGETGHLYLLGKIRRENGHGRDDGHGHVS